MQKENFVFIARGIGITPFRSMIKYMLDTNLHLPMTLIYSTKKEEEFLFKVLLEKAEQQLGLKIIFIKSENGDILDESLISKYIKDFANTLFYISGPQELVESYRDQLQKRGATYIKTDLFSGYE